MNACSGIYVASRAIPERVAMWQYFRSEGYHFTSTWIDEPDSTDISETWTRIGREVNRSKGLIFYAEPEDFPLKGALVEVGMALGKGKPVALILPDVKIEARSMRPVGSWMRHTNCALMADIPSARKWIDGFKREHDIVTVVVHGHNARICRQCLIAQSKLMRPGMTDCKG